MSHRCYRAEHCRCAETITVDAGQLCECACHNGPYYACSIEGGCGTRHTEMTVLAGAGIQAPHGLCEACERVVTADIGALGHDYDQLRAAQYDSASGGMGEVVAASRELPVPISLSLDSLAGQIAAEVTTFAEPVAEVLGIDWDAKITPKTRSRHGAAPTYAADVVFSEAHWLLRNAVPTLLALGRDGYALWRAETRVYLDADGLTIACGLADLHRAARGVLGVTRYTQRLPVNCPRCQATALTRPAGVEGAYCAWCRVSYSEVDYRELTLVVADVWSDAAKGLAPRRRPRAGHGGTVARPLTVHAPDQIVLPYTVPAAYPALVR